MSDSALSFLLTHRQYSNDDNILWILAESHDPLALQQIPTTDIINSNRLTGDSQLDARISFNDFDFSMLTPQKFEQVYYRIAKEKPINTHILASATHLLADNATLTIAGQKKEGIKSLQKAAQKIYQQVAIKKFSNDYLLHCKSPRQLQNTTEYHQHISVDTAFLTKSYFSKAGVFSKAQLDPGSEVLLGYLEAHTELISDKTVLDLGCGSGVLSLFAAEKSAKHVTATDNNATALAICHKNFAEQQVSGAVVPSYIADIINNQFELILCNPPFHQGFEHQQQLTEQFLKATLRCLTANGLAYWVTNSFINVSMYCSSISANCYKIYVQNNFTIYQISH